MIRRVDYAVAFGEESVESSRQTTIAADTSTTEAKFPATDGTGDRRQITTEE
jgi:hypothetical protein